MQIYYLGSTSARRRALKELAAASDVPSFPFSEIQCWPISHFLCQTPFTTRTAVDGSKCRRRRLCWPRLHQCSNWNCRCDDHRQGYQSDRRSLLQQGLRRLDDQDGLSTAELTALLGKLPVPTKLMPS